MRAMQESRRAENQRAAKNKAASHSHPRAAHPASGFTLIELLVVIAIIGVLAGLLFPALKASINKARRTVALAEVKALETAWKKYYQEYTGWPNTAPFMVPDAQARALPIKDRAVRALQGENDTANNNTRQMLFMEFARLDSAGNPYNPWGSKDPSRNTYKNYYYVKFDTDFDNMIPAGGGSGADAQPRSSVRANVLVWTYNPTVPENRPDFIIGNWSK